MLHRNTSSSFCSGDHADSDKCNITCWKISVNRQTHRDIFAERQGISENGQPMQRKRKMSPVKRPLSGQDLVSFGYTENNLS